MPPGGDGGFGIFKLEDGEEVGLPVSGDAPRSSAVSLTSEETYG
jgi:hypothetical protein